MARRNAPETGSNAPIPNHPLDSRPLLGQHPCMKILCTLAICLGLPALAETPMTSSQFDAYTQGKTLYYGNNGQHYGAEEYLANKGVRWSFLDGKCKEGYWYADQQSICFVYEDNPDPQCWKFFLRDGKLLAEFTSDNATTNLYEVDHGDTEMLCLGPDVGV